MKREAINREERINRRVEAMKAHRQQVQRQKKRVPVIISGICAAILLLGGAAFGVTMLNVNHAKPATTAATKLTNNKTGAATTAKTVSAGQDGAQPAAQAVDTAAQTYDNNQNNTVADNAPAVGETSNTSAAAGTTETAKAAATGTHHSGAVDNGKGTALHFYETGKTAKGYDWRYEGGNGLVDVGCDYTFRNNGYDFSLVGKTPGSGSITVWHNTDDNTQTPTTINFTVDENLNVTYN